MVNYQYIAKTAGGEEVAGVMQADNENAVVRTLDEKQLYPVRVWVPQAVQDKRGGGKIRLRDMAALYGQLADLMKAGVPLLRSMDTIIRAASNRRLAAAVTEVRDEVSGGKTLAEAMANRPQTFPPLHSAMVRAGEKAGFLEDVMVNLSGFLERQDELRSKVRGALIYPLVLTVIGAVITVAVLVLLVPQFKPLFKNISLPAPTMVLFALSDLLCERLWLLGTVLVGGFFAVRYALRSDRGKDLCERFMLRVPLVGSAAKMIGITRFCRILGTMLANGVPLLSALAISKDAAGNRALAASIESAAESVRAGQPLAEPLKAGGLFPSEVLEMIAVAEESNQMEKVLVQIADTVERHTNRRVDNAVRLIEPLILVLMAAVIGFVAVGLMFPIFSMSETLR